MPQVFVRSDDAIRDAVTTNIRYGPPGNYLIVETVVRIPLRHSSTYIDLIDAQAVNLIGEDWNLFANVHIIEFFAIPTLFQYKLYFISAR